MNQRVTNVSLNGGVFQVIADYIEPFVLNVGRCNALITRTFFNEPVVNDIEAVGAAPAFAPHLTTALNGYDEASSIINLLETLKKHGGAKLTTGN
jgi:hypothetical protein